MEIDQKFPTRDSRQFTIRHGRLTRKPDPQWVPRPTLVQPSKRRKLQERMAHRDIVESLVELDEK